MKDAIGSSVLFYVILIFLAIFIIFIAFIMQYATAFRASNYVVTMLERTEGQIDIGSKDTSVAGDGSLYGYLKERLYYGKLDVACSVIGNPNTTGGAVYRVTTQVQFKLPLLEVDLPIYINNETKTIYKVGCSSRAISKN